MTSDTTELIKNVIIDLLGAMGFSTTVDVEDTITKGLVFNVNVNADAYMLIGRRGETLHHLEHLVQAIVSRKLQGEFIRFSLDLDDFKRKREWYLKETVQQAITQLRRTGRPVGLLSMPNYERRFIHALVQNNYSDVISSSQGEGLRRRVVLRLKS